VAVTVAAPGVAPAAFRNALGHFLTGVTIVTTAGAGGQPVGMTANAFTSVSLDPPLVMVCLARSAASFSAMERAERFAVHILHGDQHELSTRFARSASAGEDKFAGVAWYRSEHGVPLLEESLARLQCSIIQRIELGDHVAYVGHVDAADAENPAAVSPLGFFRGRYARLAG
jgi:flavin reductase (DIM6/NTAB) family NADH-FMN oxidoreductase RutF